jgi:hypothetical protein
MTGEAGAAAPRITIVIPVSGVQELGACLDSILAQPFSNIELIAVPTGRTALELVNKARIMVGSGPARLMAPVWPI